MPFNLHKVFTYALKAGLRGACMMLRPWLGPVAGPGLDPTITMPRSWINTLVSVRGGWGKVIKFNIFYCISKLKLLQNLPLRTKRYQLTLGSGPA